MAIAVAESMSMFETVESLENDLVDLNQRYCALKEAGLDESHPRVQFVVVEFRKLLTRYEKASAA